MNKDGRFARRYPCFRWHWDALACFTSRTYLRSSASIDAQLSVEELRRMVGRDGEVFSNRVRYYATSLRGTRQYWRSRLIAMVDTLGLPTVFFFFTHIAADLQWPEPSRLICPVQLRLQQSSPRDPIHCPLPPHREVHWCLLRWTPRCQWLLVPLRRRNCCCP